MLDAIISQILPFTVASAAGTSSFIDNLVSWGAGLAGGIIAIALMISLVKDAIDFAKGSGSGSFWKILGKAVFLVLMIGLVFLAVNYKSLGNTAMGVGNKAIDTINTEVNTILP